MNKILEHTQLENVQPFDRGMLRGVEGYIGNHTIDSRDTWQALRLLRRYYAKPQADLQALVSLAWPERTFRVAAET